MRGSEKKIFFLCDGKVPECKKKRCYKNETETREVCKHTSDITHALNFRREVNTNLYFERK